MAAPSVCALCRSEASLLQSHILPAFVFRWLKETSGTGHVRSSLKPNVRVQDGLKKPWLCQSCESSLGSLERSFANTLFRPFAERNLKRIRYGDWLLKFCISVSWRILRHHQDLETEKVFTSDWTEEQKRLTDKAETTWRDVLLGRRPHPERFEQHLVFLGELTSPTDPRLPNNIHRYMLRGVEMDMVASTSTAFTYAKLGPLVILGVIQRDVHRWSGSRIAAKNGVWPVSRISLPGTIFQLIQQKAVRYGSAGVNLSAAQRAKIEASALDNWERFVASDQHRAMMADQRAFGSTALLSNHGDVEE